MVLWLLNHVSLCLLFIHQSHLVPTNILDTMLQAAKSYIRCPQSSENYAVVQNINKSTAEISFSGFAHTLWELRGGVFESDLESETFSRSENHLEFLPSKALKSYLISVCNLKQKQTNKNKNKGFWPGREDYCISKYIKHLYHI